MFTCGLDLECVQVASFGSDFVVSFLSLVQGILELSLLLTSLKVPYEGKALDNFKLLCLLFIGEGVFPPLFFLPVLVVQVF